MSSKHGRFRTLLSNRLHSITQPCNSPNRPRNKAKRSEVGRTGSELAAGIFRAGVHASVRSDSAATYAAYARGAGRQPVTVVGSAVRNWDDSGPLPPVPTATSTLLGFPVPVAGSER